MELTREQIKQGLDEAYKEAGHNAYFGNGFEAGVKYAQEQLKILNIPVVSKRSELLIAFADWVFEQPLHLGGRERELVAEYLKAINSH